MLRQVAEAHGMEVHGFITCQLRAPELPSSSNSFCSIAFHPFNRSMLDHMGVLSLFLRSRPRLICGVLALGSFGAAVHLAKRKLDRTCPRVPAAALPKLSACRNVIESISETTAAPAWGLEKPAVISSWPSGDDKTHWTPSFAALQAEVPFSVLARYGPLYDKDDEKHTRTEGDAFRLMQAFVAAFLDARGTGPEAWVLDKEVPLLSFAPGSHLFGHRSGLGAYMLDTWSTERRECVQPLALPKDAPRPVSEFLPNTAASHGDLTDTAGAVMYWRFADGTVRMMDKAASCGLPWRLMKGGFQEFIVEKVSHETARVTYAMVESANLHPGGQSARDFKRMPWLAYELHVLYAQFLLYKTLNRLRKS